MKKITENAKRILEFKQKKRKKELKKLRKMEFYLTLISAFFAILLLIVFLTFVFSPSKTSYYLPVKDECLLKERSLDERIYSDEEIAQTASSAVKELFTLNYVTWKDTLKLVTESNLYTFEVHKEIVQNLTDNGFINEVLRQKGILTVDIVEYPKVKTRLNEKNAIEYQVIIPLKFTMHYIEKTMPAQSTSKAVATVRFKQVSTKENKEQLKIQQVLLQVK